MNDICRSGQVDVFVNVGHLAPSVTRWALKSYQTLLHFQYCSFLGTARAEDHKDLIAEWRARPDSKPWKLPAEIGDEVRKLDSLTDEVIRKLEREQIFEAGLREMLVVIDRLLPVKLPTGYDKELPALQKQIFKILNRVETELDKSPVG